MNQENKEWIGVCMLPKQAIWFLVLFFSLSRVLAQTQTSDSLQVVGIMNRAHEHLIQHQYKEAIQLAEEGLNKSTKLDFKWGIVNGLLAIGQSQKSLSNYPAALNYYLQALSEIEKQNNKPALEWVNLKIGELFQEWGVPEKALPYYMASLRLYTERTNKKSSFLLERIAQVHLRLNQNDQSLNVYFELLEMMREKGDTIQIKSTLEKIAFIYFRLNDLQNSLQYNLQILEINVKLNDVSSRATSLNIIGNHYRDLKNDDKALQYYQAALTANKKANANGENNNSIVTNLINIGAIYQSKGDYRNAIKSFDDALQMKEKSGNPVEIAVMHSYVASLYLSQSNYMQAEDYTKKAIKMLTGTDNKRMLATNYKRLSEIYGKQGNYEKSLVSYQVYSILNDSLLYREQLAEEKEKLKQYAIESAEKEAKLSLIDQEMQALEFRNGKEIAEREKQQITLLLKEKELQNVSLQNEQLEQARSVQQLQLKQSKIEKERQEQAILLLEQKRDLQNAEIQKRELLEQEREKEIAFKNTRLELQQSQLEQVGIRQQYLIYTAILFLAIIILVLVGYIVKQRDNKKLQTQYDEINRQKSQIESINKSLVELNEEKNDLIGIVAHDLKSPLNQISGMLEIIKLTSKDQPEEQQEYTAKIEQSTNRLRKMVTKILDVSAIESKTLNITLEKVNITQLLDDIVNRFTVLAEKKNIVVVKQFETNVPSLTSDAGYVGEVLENLMSNAVKYSPLGKQITVKLSDRGGQLRVEFMDQGEGISPTDLKNLFGKYHKLTAKPTAGEDSTGLGLSIVKKYVLALNGKVWCESEEGRGSNFIVELPV